MKNQKITDLANAIKQSLIEDAIAGKLDGDMNQFDTTKIEKLLKKALKEQNPIKLAYIKAGDYLSGNDNIKQVKLIVAHENENDLIDWVDGVEVCERFESSFTCETFLEQIGYPTKK